MRKPGPIGILKAGSYLSRHEHSIAVILQIQYLKMAKTRKLRSWSSADMANAIDAVRRKELGLKKASKIYKVPRTTLQRLAKEQYGTPLEAAKTKVGRPTVLSRELEEELVQYCLAMEASFLGLPLQT